MTVFDEVAEELFGDPDKRGKFGTEFGSKYCNYEGEPMNVDQLRRIQQTDPHRRGNPNGFRKHPEYDYMYQCFEDVLDEWPSATILMDGVLGTPDEWWVDTVYVFYDQVDNQGDFEEWAVLAFKSSLRTQTKGVSPSDPRVTFENECFRYPDSDQYLLATTDEFSFRERDEHGKYVRMWWDD